MSTVIDTDTTIDYFSVTHKNMYRMRIDPDQRAMIIKYLRLIEYELDGNPITAKPPFDHLKRHWVPPLGRR